MSKRTAIFVLCIVFLGVCRARHATLEHTSRTLVRISTDDPSLIAAFASLPQFSVKTVTIGATEKRLLALQESSVDVASTVADTTYLGFNGRLPDRYAPLDGIRGIALVRRTTVHLIFGPNASTADGFRGKRVVLGRPTGGNASLGERLVNSTGVATSEMRGEFLPSTMAVAKLLKGRVDAVITTGRPPVESVTEALRGGARLADIDEPEIDRLRRHYPLIRRTLIPAGTYPYQHDPVRTVGIDLLLVCRANLSNDLVHALTRAYFEELPERIRRLTDPQRAPATVIPLHPGAARYYRQREMHR